MATVSFDHVTKRFGTVSAVDDFDLHIEEREFVVFVGPSGCGKTTALRMVAGLEQPSEGFIRIDGRIVNDVPPKDRDIAMVFQNYALYPHMTVRRNMSFGLRLRHTEAQEAEARVAEAAEILQIGHLLERRPKELSGGQRQRVALGRAIVRKPKVFLMDEPLSNLDAKLRVEMRASLAELHQALGVTTIYVTHDQVEAMTMGTRIVVMKEGRIQQVDTPTRLYQHPASKFVGGFIGSPAMNFLTGRVEGERIVGPAFDVGPDPDLVARLAPYQGREVYFGIRPENLDLKGHSDFPDDNVVRAVVKLVEPIGAETIVIGVAEGGQNVVARVDPEADVAVGETVELLVNPRKMQAFDLDTEQNLHSASPISPRLPTPTPDADRPAISNPVG